MNRPVHGRRFAPGVWLGRTMKTSLVLSSTVVVPLWIAACCESPKPSPADAAPRASASVAPTASMKPARPDKVEVEVTGKVELPAGYKPKGELLIFVSQKDCLDPGAPILGWSKPAESMRFFIEVFPAWGTDITICAAEDPGSGKPTTVYGQAPGKHYCEGLGEVTFDGLTLALKQGPPRNIDWAAIRASNSGERGIHSGAH